MSAPTHIVHLMPTAGPASFGLGTVALNLAREQNALGSHAVIWSLDNEADRAWAADSSGLPVNKIRSFPTSPPHVLRWSRAMERAARSEGRDISVVQLHALWTGVSRVANLLRREHAVPTVITPHGALQSWALRKSRWKKKVALALYEAGDLRNASCFHAVGENEIADIRGFGLTNPIAVIPNGIPTEWLESEGDARAFRDRFHIPADKRVLLFLSRITPKKGLPMLLEAVCENRKPFADWHLVLAGADEFGHQAEVEALIRQKQLESTVSVVGSLYGQLKRDAFAAAELFILPSYSEGAPIVILEALGAAVPVLATKASPWRALQDRQCGWWVDISVEAISMSLGEALRRGPDELQRMGARGKDLVASRHTWKQSAQLTSELYAWLSKRGDKPDFVVVD